MKVPWLWKRSVKARTASASTPLPANTKTSSSRRHRPKKVARIALQNAASVASLLLTTECAIADKPEPKKDAPAMPDMGGMGGMGGMY